MKKVMLVGMMTLRSRRIMCRTGGEVSAVGRRLRPY
jgi:hypothetical protein